MVLPDVVIDVEAGVVGRGPDDPVWDVAWLAHLRDVPENATWPRFMTVPHPAAVGSYGAECVAWLQSEGEITSRWWQELTFTRQLEHDAEGELVWLEELVTTSRQSGKSTKLRGGAMWRLHQADRFGEQQLILHTAKDLEIAREVRREGQAWATVREYDHRESNGSEEITEPVSGSRWLVRGKSSVYGYSASYAIGDECWGLAAEIIDDGLEATMLERRSPQITLASTAHRKATTLFPERRAQALAELDHPGSTLLIEWSAPRSCRIDDRAAWRQASPHWSAGRERMLEARLARVQAGQTLDPDEADPTESFRCQFLNSWLPQTVTDAGQLLLDLGVWARARGSARAGAPVFAAIEDYFGKGSAVAVVARVFEGRDHGRLLLGPSMWDKIGGSMLSARTVTSTDTRTGLSLLRQLVTTGRVMHDQTAELDAQLATVRVRELSSGMNLVPGVRADLVKAAVWALQAAHRRRIPAVH
jgi:hypothetical protein